MDLYTFCRELPKVELHAHLNGSLSKSTMMELQRYLADSGIRDETNAFTDEFVLGAGDTRTLSDCFQVFSIAHALTCTPEAIEIATCLTLQEFQADGCCYIELRSTPRNTPHMTKEQCVAAILQGIQKSSLQHPMESRLIISINRSSNKDEVEEIADLAIEFHRKQPELVVGIELSGNPTVGEFKMFVPALTRAKLAGLKITLHCGEVCNPKEILEMIEFRPDRIGHAICIHPKYGGTKEIWTALCKSSIPIEVCLTSNVNTKSVPSYDSHHFKLLYDAGLPIAISTDDKGVFATSLSQEYRICADTFNLSKAQIAQLARNACQFVFDTRIRNKIQEHVTEFMNKNNTAI
ncbi:adenosine deaminase-like protein [Achroia grisella]|uniref:adenosine deaminase-like protein n=1 Tax=Achroia grisella TaxID=688607 RepID=UPI0027D209D5|nr:adenosine deaminase-like protein [Achroia grisella]